MSSNILNFSSNLSNNNPFNNNLNTMNTGFMNNNNNYSSSNNNIPNTGINSNLSNVFNSNLNNNTNNYNNPSNIFKPQNQVNSTLNFNNVFNKNSNSNNNPLSNSNTGVNSLLNNNNYISNPLSNNNTGVNNLFNNNSNINNTNTNPIVSGLNFNNNNNNNNSSNFLNSLNNKISTNQFNPGNPITTSSNILFNNSTNNNFPQSNNPVNFSFNQNSTNNNLFNNNGISLNSLNGLNINNNKHSKLDIDKIDIFSVLNNYESALDTKNPNCKFKSFIVKKLPGPNSYNNTKYSQLHIQNIHQQLRTYEQYKKEDNEINYLDKDLFIKEQELINKKENPEGYYLQSVNSVSQLNKHILNNSYESLNGIYLINDQNTHINQEIQKKLETLNKLTEIHKKLRKKLNNNLILATTLSDSVAIYQKKAEVNDEQVDYLGTEIEKVSTQRKILVDKIMNLEDSKMKDEYGEEEYETSNNSNKMRYSNKYKYDWVGNDNNNDMEDNTTNDNENYGKKNSKEKYISSVKDNISSLRELSAKLYTDSVYQIEELNFMINDVKNLLEYGSTSNN